MTTEDIQQELEISLSIKKGSFFKRPEFGHQFDKLKNELATENTLKTAVKYAEMAVQWMVTVKHIVDLKVDAIYVKSDRLYVSITAVANTGDVVWFSRFVEVGDVT